MKFWMLLLLLTACGTPGVPSVPGVPQPTPTVANDEQMIRDAGVAYGHTLGQAGSIQVDQITIDGDYAFGVLTPVSASSVDPLHVFFKRERGEWQALTGGTSFTGDQLTALGVPQSLWRLTDVVEATPATPATPATDPALPGSISGPLAYPSETLPALDVFAINVTNPELVWTLRTAPGQQTYAFSDLAPGTYQLLAFVVDSDPPVGGGHSACSVGAPCEAHALEPVTLEPGATLEDVAIADWQITALPPRPTVAPMPTRQP